MFELIAAGVSGGGAFAGAQWLASWWLGKRRADTEDRRVDNESINIAMGVLEGTIRHISERCEQIDRAMTKMEVQATRVLAETNWFRITHGVQPAISLDTFEETDAETRQRIERHIGFLNPLRGAFRADPHVPADMAENLHEIDRRSEEEGNKG